jgi:proteic killer suppression protein
MIKNWTDRKTENFFGTGKVPTKSGWQQVAKIALRKLDYLDAATSLEDLRVPPGNKLEKLSGNRAGQHSIRINNQWRICFVWNDGAEDVEIVDYH